MITTQTGQPATHLINRYKGCAAFYVSDERPPEELEKLNQRGVLVVASDNANIRPHIWFGDDPKHANWKNPAITKISSHLVPGVNAYVSTFEPMLDTLKHMGVGYLFHVGQEHNVLHDTLDEALEYALRHMPKYDNVAGLYS